MLNKVILIGNVGRQPEVRMLETGSKMARFSIATNEKYYTNSGTQAVHTEWHNIVAWRGVADYVEKNLVVGSEVYLEGRIRSREAIDPRTRTSAIVCEIVAYQVRLTVDTDAQKVADDQPERQNQAAEDPDGLPF